MRGNNVLGIVFANVDDSVLSEITGIRSMASVPFAGGYRLIDFVLSNMVNSGISKVGVVTNNNYQSLMDHIGSGKSWDLARKNEGIFLLPPFNANAIDNYNTGRIGAIQNINHFLSKSTEEYVLISDCTYVSNIDLTDVFNKHEENGFDITLLTKKGKVPLLDSVAVVDKEENGRITRLSVAKAGDKNKEFVLKAAVMKKALLERLVNEAFAKGRYSFEKDILLRNLNKLIIGKYEIEGFCPVIDSLESFFNANFALLDINNYRELFTPSRPVYTKVYEDMPVVYGIGCDVKNSLIADGCIIEGEVENCIIFRDCRVEKDAVIKNSILFPRCFVAQSASLNYCITDKEVAVRSGKSLSGASTYPVYIGKGIHI